MGPPPLDLKLLRSAYYTEPRDQSCWFYLRWLLHFARDRFGLDFARPLEGEELESLGQLLAMEPTAVLALSAWIWIASRRGGELEIATGPKLEQLQTSDPLREGMYRDSLQGKTAEAQVGRRDPQSARPEPPRQSTL